MIDFNNILSKLEHLTFNKTQNIKMYFDYFHLVQTEEASLYFRE